MAAPITIEQLILNHGIGVNLSDAATLDGHPIDDFSLVGHRHRAEDITSGVFPPDRLPTATTGNRGIVNLSTSVESESTSMAATPYTVHAVREMVRTKADEQHSHRPADINGGRFPEMMQAQTNTDYTTGQLRNIFLSKNSPTNTQGNNGDIWLKYED